LIGVQLDGLRVVEILAEDGDRVAKGQVLARLDRSQLDALLAQNDAALKRSDAAIAQAKSQIAQVDAGRAQANADLARARKLDVTIITRRRSIRGSPPRAQRKRSLRPPPARSPSPRPTRQAGRRSGAS